MHLDRIPIFVCILMVAVSGVAAGASDDGPAWPILHHELEVALEPASAELRATDTIRLSPTRDPRAPLHLLLHADLELSSARLGARV